jgi:hypothetical protein
VHCLRCSSAVDAMLCVDGVSLVMPVLGTVTVNILTCSSVEPSRQQAPAHRHSNSQTTRQQIIIASPFSCCCPRADKWGFLFVHLSGEACNPPASVAYCMYIDNSTRVDHSIPHRSRVIICCIIPYHTIVTDVLHTVLN